MAGASPDSHEPDPGLLLHGYSQEEIEEDLTDEERSLSLSPADWFFLVDTLQSKGCTPFLGAGASARTIPTGAEVAREWAAYHAYPLEDTSDLPKVAQFMAVKYRTGRIPKSLMARIINAAAHPATVTPDDPHSALADLNLALYITTNFDSFMSDSLKIVGRQPRVEVCRWNNAMSNIESVFDDPDFRLTAQKPVVYHLHGSATQWQSLVLTENDYIDFLVNTAASRELVPPAIRGAIAGTSLLFLGYRLADLNFRVLFQAICRRLEDSLAEAHISVQLPPVTKALTKEQRKARIEYLNGYFSKLNVKVFWGSCEQFVRILRKHISEQPASAKALRAVGTT